MSADSLAFSSIAGLVPRIANGEVRPTEVLEACIARIEAHDPLINAFITRTFDLARRQAREREGELARGFCRGPLHGVPVALKDLLDLEGFPTTAGSRILKDHVPRSTAPAVRRLIEAGAVILGKTNLQEFARGGTGADSFFGPSRNPWDTNRTTGGSSSGSGAAVAAGFALGALGSDTGGSVRLPAAFCGLAGIRGTYGRVSRSGAVPLGRSFDAVGPLARTVEDAAILLQAIAGPDPADPSTGRAEPPDFRAEIGRGVEGLTLGVPSNYFWPGYDREVEGLARAAVSELERQGARLVEVEVPWAVLGQVAYAAVVGPESAEYHLPFLRERREEYVSPGADFFEQSLFIPGWRYVQAQRARTLFIRQAAALFRRVDAILTPTIPIQPPAIADCLDGMKTWAPISHATAPFSTVGVPAVQVPCGFTRLGLPAGLQIAGRWGEEALLVRIAAAYERAHPWWKRRPPVAPGAPPPAPWDIPSPTSQSGVGATGRSPLQTEEQIKAFAEAMNHRVAPERLDALTAGVNRLNASLAALDALDLKDCERAETLDVLTLKVENVPEA
ncbi:MAG: amidase [Candidatus Tectomicrobia bacterium]|uniref:Amidase n=1 Tax=Tectimicrobiota bacterium TaxID=2528274 RepID=A0A932HZJ3_UNCTE|nr:amidase [Candidatus Tectomicrobia bacterium]